ncbi:fumarylacetoacetate hydrolase family protein [Sphingorhabdus sp. SMR4y]|uniref:fumarylacetoacetate hydrolase family protein n=1 Tax=Sphingorhabdus sp. SMR4y TaxID=2584094 RepID=UPI000B5D0455|nr:fumarylacetoacetate hydrolase family protein [Sphingorhabdus sp. SMR4y]ASK89706.1 ureidoglycolate lyase [Sphingorhabdus sp. SMR4y]
MKLVTFTHGGTTRIGALTDGGIVDLNATDPSLPADMLALLRSGDAAMATAKAAAQSGSATLSLDDVTLESPIPNPSKILAIGINYEDHLMEVPEHIRKERNLTMPTVPVVFNKQVTSMNAPYGDIVLPPESLQMDYEAELAVIIGKTCRRVSEADALSVIAGYTILNDVTIRCSPSAPMSPN